MQEKNKEYKETSTKSIRRHLNQRTQSFELFNGDCLVDWIFLRPLKEKINISFRKNTPKHMKALYSN